MDRIEAFNHETAKQLFKCSFGNSLAELNVDDIHTIDMDDCIIAGTNCIILTDYDHPYATSSFITTGIHINHEYFNNNQDKVIQELIRFISTYKEESIRIKDSQLITTEVIKAIADNTFIKTVNLGGYNQNNNYRLTNDHYLILKNASKESITTEAVESDLEETFDPLITYNMEKYLLGHYTYDILTNNTSFFIGGPILEEQLRFIKYIPDGSSISLEYDDFDNISLFLSELIKTGKHHKVTIAPMKKRIKEKLTTMLMHNRETFSSLDLNVKVDLEDSIPYQKYLEYENRLYKLVDPAVNLSPFEKYLYAYKVTSHFKAYKENKQDTSLARKLYHILDSEFMVCVGYSTLLEDLLNKLGIESYSYGVTADLTFDKVDSHIEVLPDDIDQHLEHHARRIVHIDDPKYGINGFYICDPTWDNFLEIDTFAYAALTPNEAISGNRRFTFNNYDGTELLHINSLEELYEKINYISYHNRDNSEYKNLPKDVTYAKEIKIIMSLLDVLYNLDKQFIYELIAKYPNLYITSNQYIATHENNYSLEELQELLLYLGEYLLTRVNNPITADIYEQALYQMYLNGFCFDESLATDKTAKSLHNTYVITRDYFTRRMKIKSDGSEEIYENALNKFADYNLKKEEQMNL